MRAVHILTRFDTLCNAGYWKGLVTEIVVVLFTPYPFLMGITYTETNTDYDFESTYEINHFLTVLSFIKTYILIRWYLTSSRYMNARAYRVSTLNGCTANFSFAMKCLMKEIPLTL